MNKELKYFQNHLSSVKNLSNKTIDSYTTDIKQLNDYLNFIKNPNLQVFELK